SGGASTDGWHGSPGRYAASARPRRAPRASPARRSVPAAAGSCPEGDAMTINWSNGAGCVVMLSFDLDGETLWIARDPALAERPIHMSMGAYGPKTAMPRILRLMDRYDLKVGFYVPGWIIERY